MAIKTYYGEELYFRDGSVMLSGELERCIRTLLTQNRGVGIIGGFYEPGVPLALVSKLTLDLFGYGSTDELVARCGGSVLPLFAPAEGEAMTEAAFRALPPVSEQRMYQKNGQTLWVRAVRQDRPEGRGLWLMSLCDIDDAHTREEQLVLAKEEAERASLAKTHFLSRMSHDIRTPMNGMLGMARIAQANVHDPAVVSDALQKIIAAGQQLKLLIDEVLDMGQLESGRVELLHEPFDLHTEVEKVDTVLAMIAAERGVYFPPVQYLQRDSHVRGSLPHLCRVLENIVTNAIKYTPAGGHVERRLEQSPLDETHALFRFTVQDTGVGMSAEFQKHMFEPFAREDGAAVPGTGLGLAITHELVEKMGGSIQVKSAPGAGTRVTVTLPLELLPAPAEPPVCEDALHRELAGLRVLLAEDNGLNREIMEFLLRQTGVEAESVQTGRQALETFLASPTGYFGLILMDVMMPELSGLDAARCIRRSAHPQAQSIPIIAVTANAFAADIRAALDAGMNDHIAKPIDTPRLYAVLQRYCGKK